MTTLVVLIDSTSPPVEPDQGDYVPVVLQAVNRAGTY